MSDTKLKNGKSPTDVDDVSIEVKDVEVDTRCGIGRFKPRGLQPVATVGWFTAFYSVASLMMSTIIVYVNSQITTLERQFGFNSKQTGLIMAANDIGYLICVLFVSHSAKMVHIPRALGFSAIVFGVSGLVCSFPHFFYGSVFIDDVIKDNSTSFPAQEAANQRTNETVFGQLCSLANRSDTMCQSLEGGNQDKSSSAQRQAAVSSLIIIVVGMMLQGFGKAPRASFSIIYIDDNTNRVKSGFYFGIMIALSIMGPAIAFAMGGIFTRIYVTLGETDLYPKHPRWIGAWWLGFLVFGGVSVLVSIPLFCFPSKLPKKEPNDKHRNPIYKGGDSEPEKEKDRRKLSDEETGNKQRGNAHQSGHHSNSNNNTEEGALSPSGENTNKSFPRQAKLFLSSLSRILTNPVFVFMVCSSCFIIFMVGGSSAYSPKYLERVFDLPAYKANYIMAGKTLLSSCLGTFIGGYLTKYYKMTAKKALLFSVSMSFVSFLLSVISMFAYCDQPVVYNWPGETDASLQTCHEDCRCEEDRYFPVCGGDGKTYYSPCTAGCLNHTAGIYSNCGCVEGGQATPGICPYGCNHVYFFAIVKGLGSLAGTLCIIPKVTVIIRTVEERDKSLALGVSSFMASLLGWLLGPVAFGILIDGICSLWDRKCGTVGRCLLYDNDLFRWKLNGFSSLGIGGAFLCQLIALLYALKTGCLNDIGLDGKGDRVKVELNGGGTDRGSGREEGEGEDMEVLLNSGVGGEEVVGAVKGEAGGKKEVGSGDGGDSLVKE